jgi:hypothetical protein
MKSLYYLLLILPPSLAQSGKAEPAMVCNDSVLPASAHRLLNLEFPEWRPKHVSDMNPYDQQLWLTAEHSKDCPGIVSGHFETADELSYALLLVPKSNPSEGHKIVVLSKGAPKSAYTWKLLLHGDGTSSGLVISKAAPGKYSDWENKKSIQLKMDGILVEWLEKAGVLYFWSKGQYHELTVSD